jgi:antitoxin (DNA-binding transcriptional repressor) of toxin-antitoxin stability system
MVMVTLTTSEFRATLPQVLDRVEAGEEVVLTRHGRHVAVLVRPDALRARRAGPALEAMSGVLDRLAAARRRPLPEPAIAAEDAEALVAQVRAGRDAG